MILLELFLNFIKIGLFSFGGGYAAVPLIQNVIVDTKKWIEMSEFVDLITIAEMTPGPIALNSASFVGQRLAGFPGAIVATLGCIFPSLVIVLILAWLYFKYKNLKMVQGVLSAVRPAIVSMIASAGVSILVLALFDSDLKNIELSNLRYVELILFIVGLVLIRKFKLNAMYIIFGSGVVGTLIYLLI
ncbi:MAG: chromate transporter [Clostridiales bacterium]|nr:chromate transporter [Clostridiales bacterium]